MRDFARPPTRMEHIIAVVLSGGLVLVLGALLALLAWQEWWVVAGIFAVLFLIASALLYRAVSGAPRALRPNERLVVSWVLVMFGIVGLAVGAMTDGSIARKLLLLGPSLSTLAMGLLGMRPGAHRG